VEIIAHRGASIDAPENTLAAVALAWAQGADAVEVDVHLTRDGRLAVIHDPDTRRTGGVDRKVAELTMSELQQLDVGRWKSPRFTGEPVPTLESVLATVPAGKRLFVELKGGPELVPALVRVVDGSHDERGLRPEQMAVISFDLETVAAAKRALPRCEACWIADAGEEAPCPSLAEIAAKARARGLDGIDVAAAWPLERGLVQQICGGGFKLYVWTVDDAASGRRFAASGVDGLTTNRPGRLRAEISGAEGLSSS
jgi:glycerophosphoryl diester phosphodiesterase